MTPFNKSENTKETADKTWKDYFLTAYIIFTICLIAYLFFSYFRNTVYLLGQQNGYQAAVIQLMERVSDKCEPIPLTAGNEQVDVINMACLQQPQDGQQETYQQEEVSSQ